VILFDSLPAVASTEAWRDSSGTGRRGDLDAALVVGVREAVSLRNRFDSVEVVVVSPLLAEEVSEGTAGIVADYGRPVQQVPVRPRPPRPAPVIASAVWPPATDPVGAALRLATGTLSPWLRVVRDSMAAADSAHATRGGLVLEWPDAPQGYSRADGVLSASGAVVGAFARVGAPAGMPVAWWSDGSTAAAEEPLGAGCVRHVGIGLPIGGDAVLRPAFQRLVRDLAVQCDWHDARVLEASERAWLVPPAGSTPAITPVGAAAPFMRRILLLLALLAMAAEWWLRQRRGRGLQMAPALKASGGPA
jgi:hypothetical protein